MSETLDQGLGTSTKNTPSVIIEPLHGWLSLDIFRDLWEYREMLYFLIWRDLKVRYKQTVIGGLWAVLQPLMTMVVFSVLFGALAGLPSDGIPYPVFTFAALLPWQLFAHALSESSNSLVINQQLLTKVYFPRLIIPIAGVLGGIPDFGIGFVVLIGLMAYYHLTPTAGILFLPLFLLLAVITALAVGLWLAVLNVEYRDVRFTVPFLIQLWFFVTPVAYSSTLIPEPWRLFLGLNPMTGVVEGFRWALFGTTSGSQGLVLLSILVVIVLLAGGLIYFRRMEGRFADIV